MEHTVKGLRSSLVSLILKIGREPRRFARDHGRDFTRRRKLNVETLISTLLCLGGGNLSQELMDCFGLAAPVSAFVQQRDCCLWRWRHCFTASQTNWKRRSVGMSIASWLWTEHP